MVTSTAGKKGGSKTAADAARASLITTAQAIPEKEVRRPPSYAVAWLGWAGSLSAQATQDAAALAAVPLPGGALTAEELARFAAGVTLATEYVKVAGVLRVGAVAKATDAESKMLKAARADERLLDRAFVLRFADDSGGRALLRRIRRGDASDPVDAVADAEKLLVMADSDAQRAWLESLPKGEGAAAQRLRDALPGLRAMVARLALAKDVADKRELFRQVLTVVEGTAARVGRAGRYLTGDVPGREREYAGFTRPKARKPRKKKGAAAGAAAKAPG